jgi:hypothetical protein
MHPQMKLARRKINHYYSITNVSSVYRIAMGALLCSILSVNINYIFLVLHPRLKLEYFRVHGWESDWIETAEGLVHDEYMSKYEDKIAFLEEDINTSVDKVSCIYAPMTFHGGTTDIHHPYQGCSRCEYDNLIL